MPLERPRGVRRRKVALAILKILQAESPNLFGDYAIVHLVTAGGPGGETHIVSSLAFAEALRGGSLATGIAMALAVVPAYLVALLLVMRLVLRA